MNRSSRFAILLAAAAFSPAVVAAQETAPQTAAIQPVVEDSAALAAFFEAYDKSNLEYAPEGKAFRGIRDEDYGLWSDASDAYDIAAQNRLQAAAKTMRAVYDPAKLSPKDQLSFRLFDRNAKRSSALFPYRHLGYVFDQMNGAQSEIAAFLINIHNVSTKEHAEAYVSRILRAGPAIDQLTGISKERADKGVLPPKWVYPYVLSDIDNQLNAGKGAALAGHPIIDDLRGKVGKLDISQAEKDQIVADGIAAWKGSAAPAFRRLRAEMVRQQAIAGNDDGVWRFPDGAAYYNALLASYTTTDLTADQIHEIGLRETKRIQAEMTAIKDKVGFKGSLQEFFSYARTDPKFFPKSREEYLGKVDIAIKAMEKKLPDFFATLPKDPLLVKPVEAFREKSAGKAFYGRPAPDGSRPGTYYVNLYDLKAMSLNELEALAFHEGIPGHHLQLSIQTGLGEMPAFRRFGGVTAFSEGWGLYSEELAKDMGFYNDPMSDFGRLAMEILRAGRLVVDTGIHSKRWSRQQAIDWFMANTPNAEGDIISQVERYVVNPGQATAYMIGKLKIMELREKSKAALGDRFDIRAFHDVVLKSGPVPLEIMEENVDAWIAATKA
ncbi:DUF885 domain-containing protein [Sphingomonas sp. HDW15A]|uniref:DUF885 domain-containing protein n=1 Tax=Sphingomonas sp. HDW15A TaxID=2714942 RepID=UPI00140C0271|nr:DUF885 domain-containing protein [Sphingomonas sp. HDW15A]QIK96865.1 DUF885 domain-containing protein [Sphingomonas sp. HDW15A]